jgi:hypothetical protein
LDPAFGSGVWIRRLDPAFGSGVWIRQFERGIRRQPARSPLGAEAGHVCALAARHRRAWLWLWRMWLPDPALPDPGAPLRSSPQGGGWSQGVSGGLSRVMRSCTAETGADACS